MNQRKPDPVSGDRDLSFHPVEPHDGDVLSKAQMEQFNKDGFLSGINVFTSKEADDLRFYIGNLIEKVISAPDRRNYTQLTPTMWHAKDSTNSL